MKNIELTNWVSLFQEVAHEGFAEFKTVIKDENNNEFELSKIYKNNKDKTVEIIFQEHDNKKVNDMNELEKENAELKSELTKKADTNHSLVEQMAKLEEKNAELKQQIEKMINEVDKTICLSNMREREIYDIQEIFRKYNFRRDSNNKWEIKK